MNLEEDASLSPSPAVGQIVRVRTRKFLVDRVESGPSGGGTLVGLLCLDDDAQGHALDVVWELELEKSILDRDVWKSIGKNGFDDPRFSLQKNNSYQSDAWLRAWIRSFSLQS
jgi:hypothetical protein